MSLSPVSGSLMLLALCISPVLAGPPAYDPPARPEMTDVSLSEQSGLEGRLIDPFGKVIPDARVTVRQQRQVIWSGRTDGQGRFHVRGLNCGVYRVESDRISQFCRVWPLAAAPPRSPKSLLMMRDFPPKSTTTESKFKNAAVQFATSTWQAFPRFTTREVRGLMNP